MVELGKKCKKAPTFLKNSGLRFCSKSRKTKNKNKKQGRKTRKLTKSKNGVKTLKK